MRIGQTLHTTAPILEIYITEHVLGDCDEHFGITASQCEGAL